MEGVLIVAKTHMNNGACVGGLLLNTNRHIRLLTPDRTKQPEETPFDVGHLWDIEYRLTGIDRPHVESVVVMREQFYGVQPDLRETLLRRVGFAEPLPCIPAHTLLRVSLARWWKPEWAQDERCYLQLSGWYL